MVGSDGGCGYGGATEAFRLTHFNRGSGVLAGAMSPVVDLVYRDSPNPSVIHHTTTASCGATRPVRREAVSMSDTTKDLLRAVGALLGLILCVIAFFVAMWWIGERY